MNDEAGSEPANNTFVNRAWGRVPSTRAHSLWKRVKTAATIGCIGLFSYGLITFFYGEHSVFPRGSAST